jgi:hypothetical protein
MKRAMRDEFLQPTRSSGHRGLDDGAIGRGHVNLHKNHAAGGETGARMGGCPGILAREPSSRNQVGNLAPPDDAQALCKSRALARRALVVEPHTGMFRGRRLISAPAAAIGPTLASREISGPSPALAACARAAAAGLAPRLELRRPGRRDDPTRDLTKPRPDQQGDLINKAT